MFDLLHVCDTMYVRNAFIMINVALLIEAMSSSDIFQLTSNVGKRIVNFTLTLHNRVVSFLTCPAFL